MLAVSASPVLATAQSAANPRRPVKTALHQAVLDGRIHQVRLLVDKHGGNVDSRDVFGRTPLMLACLVDNESNGFRMVRIFMKAGAYLNTRDNLNRTAMHYACMKGREDIVRQFLKEENVEVNAPDNDGNTPLIHASLSGNPSIVDLVVDVFVKFGLSTDERNCLGYTALLLACKYSHYVSAHILVTRGLAQPTLRDNEFFLNALEWVKKSAHLSVTFQRQLQLTRARTSLTDIPRFSRENTLYNCGSNTPVCRHVAKNLHPLGQSLDSALRLPAVFSSCAPEKHRERAIDGIDARLLLMKEINEAIHNPKIRPLSRMSSIITRSVESAHVPYSPKLSGLGNRSQTVMVPDMRTLFRLYGEQRGVTRRMEDAPVIPDVYSVEKLAGPNQLMTNIPGIQVQACTPVNNRRPHATSTDTLSY